MNLPEFSILTWIEGAAFDGDDLAMLEDPRFGRSLVQLAALEGGEAVAAAVAATGQRAAP